jgi:beta-lactamase class D
MEIANIPVRNTNRIVLREMPGSDELACYRLEQEASMKKKNMAIIFMVLCSSFLHGEENWQSHFSVNNIKGSITIYDMERGRWFYSDEDDAHTGTLPASTFKIVHSLIALEEQAVMPTEIIPWDGSDRKFMGRSIQAWNGDMTLESAFRNSAIWFFEELSKRIKRQTYLGYLREMNYGNLEMTEPGNDFWNYGEMKITPIEQIDFLIKLVRQELPFNPVNVELVKGYMQVQNPDFPLYAKSGWVVKNGVDIGWYIGFVELDSNVYVFATRIWQQSENLPPDFGGLRAKITFDVFRELGILTDPAI